MNLSTKRVESVIEQLEIIEESDDHAYQKAYRILSELNPLPIITYTFPCDLRVYRARVHDSTKHFFDKVSDISLPPSESVKGFARCNKPFQSLFYGSENRPTSYIELVNYLVQSKSPGMKFFITIGQWIANNKLKSIFVTSPDSDKRTSSLDIHLGQAMDDCLNKMDHETKEAVIIFFRFLSKKMKKRADMNKQVYIITSAYCNIALDRAYDEGISIHSICYPSVPFKEQGTNFALTNKFVNSGHLYIKHAIREEFEVIKNKDNRLTFNTKGYVSEAKQIDMNKNKIYW